MLQRKKYDAATVQVAKANASQKAAAARTAAAKNGAG